jgi:hypothetical protein
VPCLQQKRKTMPVNASSFHVKVITARANYGVD